MFVKVRRVFTAGAILFLLGLFILPSLFLRGWSAELNGLCDQMLLCERTGEEDAARKAYEALQYEYGIMRGVAELFLDHRVMDDATLPLELMGVYLGAKDQTALEAAAAQFRLALECMLNIEKGDIRMLL